MKRHMFMALPLAYYDRTYFIVVPAFFRSYVTSTLLLYSKARTVLKSLAKAGSTLEFSNINDGNIRLPVGNNSELRITWDLSHSH
jgi:hypothetical protein